jgi:hypothetical protein
MNHLDEAAKYARKMNGIKFYFWHLVVSLIEAFWLFIWAIGSILHGIFPFLFDFELLRARINQFKVLKQKLPDDPHLQKVHFDD